MPFNGFTTLFILRVGPLVLATLVKHYWNRLGKSSTDPGSTRLKQDELLYHVAFNTFREFIRSASYHPVEELQAFTNIRTPSSPWARTLNITIPMSSCDNAAPYLVQALGGEHHARTVVGGTKWWQVRSLDGIEAQWIVDRKDWREARKRYKKQQNVGISGSTTSASESTSPEGSDTYDPAMDDMRCILYLHSGGYYFGSIDQERYSVEQYARKINGRVLAIRYRLAPQYPFPCALHDALAAYLYLINPPPGSGHRPVNPAHVVITGASSGGGLTLALLQVLRDTGLPLPAGGVLISPWCDLTHSFPSVHTNTDTDILPRWGLSHGGRSILWPPPNDEQSRQVQESFRTRVRQVFGQEAARGPTSTIHTIHTARNKQPSPADTESTASAPSLKEETITLVTGSGEELTVEVQLHLYTQNSLLAHPLVSPGLSYLGGLPPLLVIASDGEVLRDEIVYTAHKAANPARYPVHPTARELYPPLQGIEEKFSPSKVHLQIYDDAAHTLTALFPFTTPAKFCFRAIAAFCKYVYAAGVNSNLDCPPPSMPNVPSASHRASEQQTTTEPNKGSDDPKLGTADPGIKNPPRSLLRVKAQQLARTLLDKRKGHLMVAASEEVDSEQAIKIQSESDVGGPQFRSSPSPNERYAGDSAVYESADDNQPLWAEYMIRERVSTGGAIRPLEPEADLIPCNVPEQVIGSISELVVRKCLNYTGMFDRQFARQAKAIEKQRRRNLKVAEKQTLESLKALEDMIAKPSKEGTDVGIAAAFTATTLNKRLVWALDTHENPPPSSIVVRQDIEEGLKLAEIIDKSMMHREHFFRRNNLWTLMMDFLTKTPEGFTFTKEESLHSAHTV